MRNAEMHVETGVAEANDAVVAALSARLDALLASWQLGIDSQRKAPVAPSSPRVRKPEEVLAELERELADLERRCLEQRRAAQSEAQESEALELEAVRDAYRNAVTAVRATLASASTV